ncbi:TPA: hypothetical protein ACHA1K_001645 [Enterococcus faecium]|uniref:Uncharacterized protein n=2 Tax=Enterococcus TaxID=1350 RepID=A0A286Q5N6_ENTAV|nr:hypothetical protein [Enterococcus faecium]APB62562.1 hypothetical protein pEA19081_p66 [Enterococcus avium]APB62430.1 hypothetical protein pEMA120_p19 [Enterococcus faecium]EMF0336546.1 hypothetical protein [Enterococcus faecium]MBE8746834.1 hypothetical protein [Enterococcus faecium]MBG0355286.1 hypothetical protein [Enterococcus faecium]
MQENNTARILFLIGGMVILSLVITGIATHWEEIKSLIETFFQNKMIRM